jgi:hypothetical protein
MLLACFEVIAKRYVQEVVEEEANKDSYTVPGLCGTWKAVPRLSQSLEGIGRLPQSSVRRTASSNTVIRASTCVFEMHRRPPWPRSGMVFEKRTEML